MYIHVCYHKLLFSFSIVLLLLSNDTQLSSMDLSIVIHFLPDEGNFLGV